MRRAVDLFFRLSGAVAVAFLVMIALRSYLAAHGRTRPLVIAVILGNLANAGLDYIAIYKKS